jgi:clan AA aspartic protease
VTTGKVVNLHALLPVNILHAEGRLLVEFVIDTGFTGFLSLPQSAVDGLELPYAFEQPADLADGSTIVIPVHDVRIHWQGEEITVRVLATGNRPLLGTAMLAGEELHAQFIEDGIVSVTPLETP